MIGEASEQMERWRRGEGRMEEVVEKVEEWVKTLVPRAKGAVEQPGQLRWELRRSVIAALRNGSVGGEAENVRKLWNGLRSLFEGFEEESSVMKPDDIYGIVRAIKDGLKRFADADGVVKAIAKGVEHVFGAIGKEKCVAVFGVGVGFRDGLEILAQCLSRPSCEKLMRLGTLVAEVLRRLVEVKHNVSGAFDWTTRTVLIPSMRFRAGGDDMVMLNGFLAACLFHPSMEKQYKCYLASNELSIMSGKEASEAAEKSPTVRAFMDALDAEIAVHPESAVVFPFFVLEFVARLAFNNSSNAWGSSLSGRKTGFLFIAKLSGCLFKQSKCTRQMLGVFSEMLLCIQKHQLYEPAFDEDFLQLQFLQRIARKVLKESKSGGSMNAGKKKRKIVHCTEIPDVSEKLVVCEALLRIEHRAISPFLNEIVDVYAQTASQPDARSQFLELMRTCARMRKWTAFVTAILKSLASTPSLTALLRETSILETIQEATRNLPTLETPAFLETIVELVKLTNMDLSAPSDRTHTVLHVVEAMVASIRIYESNAIAISHSLSRLVPSSNTLRSAMTSPFSYQILHLSHSISRALERCTELQPRAVSDCLLSSIALETFDLTAEISNDSIARMAVECLLDRLAFLYKRDLRNQFSENQDGDSPVKGGRVADALLSLKDQMTSEDSGKLETELLTTHFVPWVTLCTSEQLTAFLDSVLENFSPKTSVLMHTLDDPVAFSSTEFRSSFCSAYFKALIKLVEDMKLPEALIRLFSPQCSFTEVHQIARKFLLGRSQSASAEYSTSDRQLNRLIDLLELGLGLHSTFFGEERIRLEMFVVVVSTISNNPRIIQCMGLFSLHSLERHAAELAPYFTAAYFQVIHALKIHSEMDTTRLENVRKREEGLFAFLKQTLMSQWAKGNGFFIVDSIKSDSKEKRKRNKLNAQHVLTSFGDQEIDSSAKHSTFYWCCLGTFVHFCRCLCKLRRPCFGCLSGGVPPSWMGKICQQLKDQDTVPDVDQMPVFLQSSIVPLVSKAVRLKKQTKEDDSRSNTRLGIIAGIVADLTAIFFKDAFVEVRDVVFEVLRWVDRLVNEQRWSSIPLHLERIAYFLHNTSVALDMPSLTEDVVVGMARTHLLLLTKVTELRDDYPNALEQPFLLATFDADIRFHDPEGNVPFRPAILESFRAFLSRLDESSALLIGNSLLQTVQEAETLESKFASLQLYTAFLHACKPFLDGRKQKQRIGEHLIALYRCFWEGYFRHMLLELVQRKKRKAVPMPDSSQGGVFLALLCCFFRSFSLCNMFSAPLPQRTTIQIMRRIKRIVESLRKRTTYADASLGAAWFGEICEFLISAVRQQKSAQAAKALFPSFRAALESLLSLLMVWELESNARTPLLERAETMIGTVYSETAACSEFAEGLPDLLFSFMFTIDSLRKKHSGKDNPLSAYFMKHRTTDLVLDPRCMERLQRRVSVVHAALKPSQRTALSTQLSGDEHLSAHLQSFTQLNNRFTGHDG